MNEHQKNQLINESILVVEDAFKNPFTYPESYCKLFEEGAAFGYDMGIKESPGFNLNTLAAEIMQVNTDKGFNDAPLNVGEAIALMHSELSEALEADRKDLMDDKLPKRTGTEVELADTIIRILHFSARKGYDIHGAVLEKLAYNKTRPYMHGGKKY